MEKVKEHTLYTILSAVAMFCYFWLWTQTGHCAEALDFRSSYQEALKRNIYVNTEHGQASGVIMRCLANRAEALTNFHVLEVESFTWVAKRTNGEWHKVIAQVKKVDTMKDLALITFQYPCEEPIMAPQFHEVQPLDPVIYVGNPASATDAASTGIVSGFWTDGKVLSTVLGIGGFSGSGLWDDKARLVGINQGFITSNPNRAYLSMTIQTKVVKDFWEDQ